MGSRCWSALTALTIFVSKSNLFGWTGDVQLTFADRPFAAPAVVLSATPLARPRAYKLYPGPMHYVLSWRCRHPSLGVPVGTQKAPGQQIGLLLPCYRNKSPPSDLRVMHYHAFPLQ